MIRSKFIDYLPFVALVVSVVALVRAVCNDETAVEACETSVEFKDFKEPVEVDMSVARDVRDTVVVPVLLNLSEWQVLEMAIAFTESRFDPDAVGKAHDSGILQLTPIYVAEVNRVAGTDYTLEDAFDIDKALEIFEAMQAAKNPDKDIETAIRYHNKAGYYRSTVLRNMTFIRNYEAVRAAVMR